MKIKPEIYANILISALEEKDSDSKKIAQNFWYSLQKNNQARELKEILSKLDEESARKQNMTLAKVYSASPLLENELANIEDKLKKQLGGTFMIKNIIKKSEIAGVVIKVDDREIDLSLNGKVNRLKQLLKSPKSVETI